jgi:hypothetical protein
MMVKTLATSAHAANAAGTRNARTHIPEQINQIAASIREWGWTVPILIDEGNGVIAGHARLQAARKLGLAECPGHLSPPGRRCEISRRRMAHGREDSSRAPPHQF